MSEEVNKKVPFEEVLRKAIHDVDVYQDPDLTEFRRRWDEIAAAVGQAPVGDDCIEGIFDAGLYVEVRYSWSSRGCRQDGTSRISTTVLYSDNPIKTAAEYRATENVNSLRMRLTSDLNSVRSSAKSYVDNLQRSQQALKVAGSDVDLYESESEAVDTLGVVTLQDAMLVKLSAKRRQGRGGWNDPMQCTNERLAEMLVDHVRKGDPVDIANFCMMLHYRKAPISVIQEAFKAATEDRKICDLSGGFDCTDYNRCEICHRYDTDKPA